MRLRSENKRGGEVEVRVEDEQERKAEYGSSVE